MLEQYGILKSAKSVKSAKIRDSENIIVNFLLSFLSIADSIQSSDQSLFVFLITLKQFPQFLIDAPRPHTHK